MKMVAGLALFLAGSLSQAGNFTEEALIKNKSVESEVLVQYSCQAKDRNRIVSVRLKMKEDGSVLYSPEDAFSVKGNNLLVNGKAFAAAAESAVSSEGGEICDRINRDSSDVEWQDRGSLIGYYVYVKYHTLGQIYSQEAFTTESCIESQPELRHLKANLNFQIYNSQESLLQFDISTGASKSALCKTISAVRLSPQIAVALFAAVTNKVLIEPIEKNAAEARQNYANSQSLHGPVKVMNTNKPENPVIKWIKEKAQ